LIVTPDWAQSRLGNFCLRKARMRRAARDDLSKSQMPRTKAYRAHAR
jgi:hypothetical protein